MTSSTFPKPRKYLMVQEFNKSYDGVAQTQDFRHRVTPVGVALDRGQRSFQLEVN